MLPGLRFLFAAIVLSISILVFGLGAAALLRAAHEQFASNSSWRAGADAAFAQPTEASRPVLAMLRIDPLPAPPRPSDSVPASASPAEPVVIPAAPTEQAAAMTSAPAAPEKMAALTPDETPLMAAKPEIAISETPAASTAAPVATDTAAASDETKVAAATPAADPKIASSAEVASRPPANETAPAASEIVPAASAQIDTLNSPQPSIDLSKIATLGDPAVTTEPQPQAKPDSAKPDQSAIKKRQQARRAARRRRMAQRAQLARLATQQAADPFSPVPSLAQPTPATRKH